MDDKIIIEWPLVSVISINYNGVDLTCAMIESLQKSSYPNLEIIIVDNNSSQNPSKIPNSYPDVVFIQSEVNSGFAGGNNLGIKHASGKYFLLLNNDTEVEPSFLEPMVMAMEKNPQIGCTSSKLLYFDSPEIIQYAGNAGINMTTGRAFGRGWGEKDKGQYNDTISIEIAHGASMLLSRKMVQDIGLMADMYFLYYEELDYCYRMLDAGYKLLYIGNSVVYHKESMSTGKESPLKTYYMTRNRALFMRRNTSGIQLILSLLYYHFIATPKLLIIYLLKGKLSLFNAALKGIYWNVTHHNIHENQFLKNDEYVS